MASGAAAAGVGAFDCCLSGRDFRVDQRPYHRNCKCGLHEKKKKSTTCHHASSPKATIGYPMRRSWSKGALALNASANTSPVVAPATGCGVHAKRPQLSLFPNSLPPLKPLSSLLSAKVNLS